MTHQDLTIQNVFETLQKEFGPFQNDALKSGGSFEDVPAAPLDAEFAHEAHGDFPKIARKATLKSTVTLAA